jgi:hypothetical protein
MSSELSSYAAAKEVVWQYSMPTRRCKTLLLTIGGICLTGDWQGALGEYYLAWAPMPKRDHELERKLLLHPVKRERNGNSGRD